MEEYEMKHLVMDDTNYDLDLKDAPHVSADDEKAIAEACERRLEEYLRRRAERREESVA